MPNSTKTFFRFRNINTLTRGSWITYYRAVAAIQRDGAKYRVAFSFYSVMNENHKNNPYSKERGKDQALNRLEGSDYVVVSAKGIDTHGGVFDAALSTVFLTNIIRPVWMPQKF